MPLLANLVQLYILVVIARIILSWFPIPPGSAFASIFGAVYALTEPVLGPLRRVLPPFGMLDLSPMVVIIGLEVLHGALLRGA